ncbi:MAG: hypothetical protein J0L62_00350 [Bacteroidetes bacterium]|nr:hypothetical protein [Bacteroidota bacterium]
MIKVKIGVKFIPTRCRTLKPFYFQCLFMKYTFLGLILLSLFSCNDPDNSKENKTCEFPAGNRNFTWRVDTVGWWPSEMGGVYAFSDDDAYAAGYFSDKKGNINSVLHWDGKKWSPVIFSNPIAELGNNPNDVTGDGEIMVTVGLYDYSSPKPGIGEYNNSTKKWKGYQFQNDGGLNSVWTDGQGYFIAAGDNGIIFEKDGYNAGWVYKKLNSDFTFYKIAGISKNEIFILGYKDPVAQKATNQVWSKGKSGWSKIFDDRDTSGMPLKIPEGYDSYAGISAFRCEIENSLNIYLVGWESVLYKAKGPPGKFEITNLANLGLTLRSQRKYASDITLFSPNDFWISGENYSFFHWNGSNFQPIKIPILPENISSVPRTKRFFKTNTGKIFIPSELETDQILAVLQGIQIK